jgi:hypothetical protein
MADNVLKAVIDVSAPGAKETFNEVAQATLKVNESLKTLGAQGALNTKSVADAIGKLKLIISQTSDPKDLQKLSIALNQLQQKASELPQHFEKVEVGSLRASNAALNLTHSLGLIPAESSHLTHGLESIIFSFENLRAETGSTSSALAGLAGTIGKGLGIGLLITATSGLVEWLNDDTAGLEAMKSAADKLKESLDNMVGSIKTLEKDSDFLREIEKLRAEAAGVKGPALELFDLKNTIAKNENVKKAIGEDLDKIKGEIKNKFKEIETLKSFPLQFEKLDFQLTAEGLIPKSAIDGARERTKIILQSYNDLVKAKIELENISINKTQENAKVEVKTAIELNKELEEARKKRIADYQKYLQELEAAYQYEKGIIDLIGADIKGLQDTFKGNITRDQKIRLNATVEINKDTLSSDFGEKFKEISKDVQIKVRSLTASNPILIRANTKIELTADEKALRKSIDNINQIIGNIAVDSISSIGDTLGKALAGGDLTKGFKDFARIIGDGFQAIGKQMIIASPIIQALKEAIKSLNPAILLPAGLALVAIGAALKQSVSGVKGFAGGGILPGAGVPVLVGERGPEIFIPDTGGRIIPNHQLSAGGISGGGSGMNVQVSGYLMGRGNDLVAIIESAKRSNNRLV